MSNKQAVIDTLYANLGAIPHEQYGHINLLPWAVDSDETNALKRQVCEGLANLLADAGHLKTGESVPAEPSRDVKLNCRSCSTTLLSAHVNEAGVANVPAATVISAVSKMNVNCPHSRVTADDQRRLIEEAVLYQQQGN